MSKQFLKQVFLLDKSPLKIKKNKYKYKQLLWNFVNNRLARSLSEIAETQLAKIRAVYKIRGAGCVAGLTKTKMRRFCAGFSYKILVIQIH